MFPCACCATGLDSSPQGKNFLLVEEYCINPEQAVATYLESLDTEVDVLSPENRKMTERRPKPLLTLGKGCGSFVHKLDALLYGLSLETDNLAEYCSNVISITTDQGVEFGVAQAPSFAAAELAKDWASILAAESQLAIMDEDNAAPASDAVDELLPASQFPNALRIPGLKHISDNLLQACLSQMKMWPDLLVHLRYVEAGIMPKSSELFC